MMTKKKSNSWARLKLLWLLPIAALSVYACSRPNNAARQSEQMIRSEDTTPPSINQNTTVSISVDPTETHSVFISFVDDTDKELRSFTLDNKIPETDSFALDIAGLEEWLKSQIEGERPFSTVSIKASPSTPMGLITDLKMVLKDYYALQIKYALQ